MNGKQRKAPVSGSRNEQMKHSKNGRKRRARRREAVTVAGALILVCAIAAVCFVFFFKVQDISVINASARYSDAAVIEASGVKQGDGMLGLKPAAVAARLCRSLPYIESAKIKRKYPDKVIISVEYAKPTLSLETPSGYVLMNNACKVLETGVQTLPDYVAELRGVTPAALEAGGVAEFTDPDMRTYVSGLSSAFAANGFLNVTAYDFSDLFNIVVEIDYKLDVKLGSINKAEGKLRFGKAVIDSTLKDAALSSEKLIVDLTGENTAYVRSRDAAEATTAPKPTEAAQGEETGEDLSSVEPSLSEPPETEPPETVPPETEAEETEAAAQTEESAGEAA